MAQQILLRSFISAIRCTWILVPWTQKCSFFFLKCAMSKNAIKSNCMPKGVNNKWPRHDQDEIWTKQKKTHNFRLKVMGCSWRACVGSGSLEEAPGEHRGNRPGSFLMLFFGGLSCHSVGLWCLKKMQNRYTKTDKWNIVENWWNWRLFLVDIERCRYCLYPCYLWWCFKICHAIL